MKRACLILLLILAILVTMLGGYAEEVVIETDEPLIESDNDVIPEKVKTEIDGIDLKSEDLWTEMDSEKPAVYSPENKIGEFVEETDLIESDQDIIKPVQPSNANLEANIHVGFTVSAGYSSAAPIGSIASSDESIVKVSVENTGFSIINGISTYYFNVYYTGQAAGTASVYIYDHQYGFRIGEISVTVVDHGEAIIDASKEPTCTEDGLTEGKHCSVCGEIFIGQETIPAKGHISVTDPGVAPTCYETGLSEGSHCSVCGKILVERSVLPLADHTPITDPAVPPTYTKTGLTEGSRCIVCGKVLIKQEVVPKLELPENGILLTKNITKSIKAGKELQIVLDGIEASSYKSSNKDVATVSTKGIVSAKLAGTAKITVTLETGKKYVLTLKVTDKLAPKSISVIQGRKANLKVGKKLALEVKLNPTKARYTLTWKSNNTSVATVSKKGVITAKKKGKATISVSTQNGKKATISIIVE